MQEFNKPVAAAPVAGGLSFCAKTATRGFDEVL